MHRGAVWKLVRVEPEALHFPPPLFLAVLKGNIFYYNRGIHLLDVKKLADVKSGQTFEAARCVSMD